MSQELMERSINLTEASIEQFDQLMKIVKDAIKKYPNDEELGAVIRYLFSDVGEKNTDKD